MKTDVRYYDPEQKRFFEQYESAVASMAGRRPVLRAEGARISNRYETAELSDSQPFMILFDSLHEMMVDMYRYRECNFAVMASYGEATEADENDPNMWEDGEAVYHVLLSKKYDIGPNDGAKRTKTTDVWATACSYDDVCGWLQRQTFTPQTQLIFEEIVFSGIFGGQKHSYTVREAGGEGALYFIPIEDGSPAMGEAFYEAVDRATEGAEAAARQGAAKKNRPFFYMNEGMEPHPVEGDEMKLLTALDDEGHHAAYLKEKIFREWERRK